MIIEDNSILSDFQIHDNLNIIGIGYGGFNLNQFYLLFFDNPLELIEDALFQNFRYILESI